MAHTPIAAQCRNLSDYVRDKKASSVFCRCRGRALPGHSHLDAVAFFFRSLTGSAKDCDINGMSDTEALRTGGSCGCDNGGNCSCWCCCLFGLSSFCDREIVLAAVAQDGMALGYAAAELKDDREIVIAAVGNNGRSLWHTSFSLRQHPALLWISTTNLALHCAKLRLTLATCASSRASLSHSRCTVTALPDVLVELIGTYISIDMAISVAARRYGYWHDSGSSTRGREGPKRKKHKRLEEDD